MSRRVTAAAVAVLAVSALTACGTAGTAETGTAGAASTGASETVSTTSAMAIRTIDGKTMQVPAGRPAALFFFSVNCGSCVGGVKSLGEAARASEQAGGKADFLLVGMDPSESTGTILEFQNATNAQNLPAAIDTGAVFSRRFKVAALSTLIVLDAAGKVTYRATDPSAEQINAALGEAGTTT